MRRAWYQQCLDMILKCAGADSNTKAEEWLIKGRLLCLCLRLEVTLGRLPKERKAKDHQCKSVFKILSSGGFPSLGHLVFGFDCYSMSLYVPGMTMHERNIHTKPLQIHLVLHTINKNIFKM
jgi:hypothetical protein